MIDLQLFLILAIIFLATFVGSTFGFGLGLIAMPLLAVIVDIKTAAPLVALVAVTTAFFIFVKSWREVNFKSIWRIVATSILGIPLGLYLIKGTGDLIMKIALALMIIAFALYNLLGRTNLTLKTDKASYPAGLLAGMLGAAYNMGGPPVIIYGALKHWSPATFRATMHGFFLPTSLFIVLGHFGGGLITEAVIGYYLYSFPILILTTIAGGMLNRALPVGRFNHTIYLFLVLIGSFLLFKSLSAAW